MTNPIINRNDELRCEYLACEEAILDEKIRSGYSHQRGVEETKIQNAINGLKKGYSLEIISDITNLSIQDIEKIKKEYL